MTDYPHPALVGVPQNSESMGNLITDRLGYNDRIALLNQVVLRLPGVHKEDLLKIAAGFASEKIRSFASDLFTSLVYSNRSDLSFDDVALQTKLAEFFNSEVWATAHEKLPKFARSGHSREEEYKRVLEKFVANSKAISIIDPYFGSALDSNPSDEHQRRLWLVSRMIKNTASPIEIYTFPPIPEKGQKPKYSLPALKQTLDFLAESSPLGLAKISVYMFDKYRVKDATGIELHKRSIRIRFASGGVCFSMQKGTDGFSQDPLKSDDLFLQPREAFNREIHALRSVGPKHFVRSF